MKEKDVKKSDESQVLNEEAAANLKVPATGVDVSAVVAEETTPIEVSPEAVPDKAPVPAGSSERQTGRVTPGRRLRDTGRRSGRGAGPSGRSGRGSRGGEGRERVKPEFDSKIIEIRRVTRVTAGGRRMNFSVAVVAGDRKGRVGVGLGKGMDTAIAVEKAVREAKKHMIKVPVSANMTIPHSVEAKFGSAKIKIFPARGSGIVAGSSARAVIEMAGLKDICAKYLSGSKNRLNNARVAIEALKKLISMPKNEMNVKKPKGEKAEQVEQAH